MSKNQQKKAERALRNLTPDELAETLGKFIDTHNASNTPIKELIQHHGLDSLRDLPGWIGLQDRASYPGWRFRQWITQAWHAVTDTIVLHRAEREAGQALDDLIDGFDFLALNSSGKTLLNDLLSYSFAMSKEKRLDTLRAEFTARLDLLESATNKLAVQYNIVLDARIIEKVKRRREGLQNLINALPADMEQLNNWDDNEYRKITPAIEALKEAVKFDSSISAKTPLLERGKTRGKTKGQIAASTRSAVDALDAARRTLDIPRGRTLEYREVDAIRRQAVYTLEHTTGLTVADNDALTLLRTADRSYISKLVIMGKTSPDLKSDDVFDPHGL